MNIVEVKGIGVVVERTENDHDEMDNAKAKLVGARNNERHCH